jgi:hypothetical protein
MEHSLLPLVELLTIIWLVVVMDQEPILRVVAQAELQLALLM